MKKLFTLVLFVLAVSGLTLMASADMGGPGIIYHEVFVSAREGATIYGYYYEANEFHKTDRKIAYGESVTLTDVVYDGDKIYARLDYDSDLYSGLEYDSYFLSRSDFALVTDEIPVDKSAKFSSTQKFAVVGKGFYLYKGPSEIYEKASGEISVGTVLSSDYYYNHKDMYEYQWVYVTYGKEAGWAHIYQYGYDHFRTASIIGEESFESYIDFLSGDLYVIGEGVRLTDKPCDMFDDDARYGVKEISDVIPKGTKLEFDFYYKQAKINFAYVEYNGVSGWIGILADGRVYKDTTAVGVNENYSEYSVSYTVDFKQGMPVYDGIDICNSNTVGHLPQGYTPKIRYIASTGDYTVTESLYGIEYNGDLCWIYECYLSDTRKEQLDSATPKIGRYKIVIESENESIPDMEQKEKMLPIYEDKAFTKKIGEVPNGAFVIEISDKKNEVNAMVDYNGICGYMNAHYVPLQDYWRNQVYCEHYFTGGRLGYAELEESRKVTQERHNSQTGEEPVETITAYEPTTGVEETNRGTETEPKSGKSLSPIMIVVLCVAAAVVLALTATVTLILINRKKK